MGSLRLSHSPRTGLKTNAHMKGTMQLLLLNGDELEERIASELSNPALEVSDAQRCRTCGRAKQQGICPVCRSDPFADTPIIYLSPRGWEHIGADALDPDLPEADPQAMDTLAEHLLRQLGEELKVEERALAASIIFSLDEDGLLQEHPAEIAQRLCQPLASVKRIIHLLQRVDPPGIGASTIHECLLIQLEMLAEEDPSSKLIQTAQILVRDHYRLLARQEFASLARLTSLPRPLLEQSAQFVHRALTPHPAFAFTGGGRGGPTIQTGRYYRPDVTINLHPANPGGPLVVEISTPTNGWVRANPEFKTMLKSAPPEQRENWEERYEQAVLASKCLQQRNNAMRRLLEAIVIAQREFILNGDRHLTSMTRAAVSRKLGVHESTISRAVAGKTVALPGGRIVPLSKFFDRSLPVREAMKQLIASEAPAAPLTDERLVRLLSNQGICIKRRTIAKYRAAEGILPAAMRAREHRRPSVARPTAGAPPPGAWA